VKTLSHELTLADMGATGEMESSFDAAPMQSLPAHGADAILSVPPMSTWMNVR